MTMQRMLILFAHPTLEKSRIHRRLVDAIPDLPGITFHDLYEEYPSFDIDVKREQALLVAHEVVVMQHPFYWYSTPAILKQWQDLVLEHGWAYGSEGKALRGKSLIQIVSTGGIESGYQPEGYNRFTVRQLLAPIEQTARLCGMTYLPPWIIYGTHRLDTPEIEAAATQYRDVLTRLHSGEIAAGHVAQYPSLNLALRAIDGTTGSVM